MMYLIAALAPWLLLTAAFAAIAGWAVAAERGAPAQNAQRRDRDKLVRDLAQLAAGEATPQTAIVSDAHTARSIAAVRDSRIIELERALEQARSRAAELAGEGAELQRRLEHSGADAHELARLRDLVQAHEAEAVHTIKAHAESAVDEDAALQAWRLRYFEQRVKFLEGRAALFTPALPAPTKAEAPALEWRAREAAARAEFLAQELRHKAATPDQGSPFAANADVDMLLRWRMLYLERRSAHLQDSAVASASTEAKRDRSDPDRWRWRARYLESRVRHLEQRSNTEVPVQIAEATVASVPRPASPRILTERPPGLPAAESGAPDDFTLIDGVSPLQQSTLYSLGIYHFYQIAAWTPANVAWVDQYLRLRGRIEEQEWVEQAAELAQFGVQGARAQTEGARA